MFLAYISTGTYTQLHRCFSTRNGWKQLLRFTMTEYNLSFIVCHIFCFTFRVSRCLISFMWTCMLPPFLVVPVILYPSHCINTSLFSNNVIIFFHLFWDAIGPHFCEGLNSCTSYQFSDYSISRLVEQL